jgi:hypothetical protein
MNTLASEFATTLTQTGSSLRADSRSMVAALQQAETDVRRSKSNIPFADLAGEWRLCFVTGASKSKQKRGIKLGKGYYLPKFVFASISFAPDVESSTEGVVTNQLKFGSFQLKFTGPCRYPGKKNLLMFDFTQIQIDLFGKTVYQAKIRSGKTGTIDGKLPESIAKMPFFAFFWAGTNEIAARGRGGGLALWVREVEPS